MWTKETKNENRLIRLRTGSTTWGNRAESKEKGDIKMGHLLFDPDAILDCKHVSKQFHHFFAESQEKASMHLEV